MKKTGFIYSPLYLEHKTGNHPESPDRLRAIIEKIEEEKIFASLINLDPVKAVFEQIALVHSRDYIQSLAQAYGQGKVYLDSDTVISAASYEVALLAAGGVIKAIDALFAREIDNAFCAVRPPGHHAEAGYAKGFCLFNNIAIGAKYALQKYGLKRILIIDWDLHHGNGTQNTFYNSDKVYYISLHQYPYYPGTGAAEEQGLGAGRGFTLNFPLSAGAGDREYEQIFNSKIVPVALEFKPELIMLSAGFDAHKDDPLGGMRLTSAGYGLLTGIIKKLADATCSGKIISVLEGGYNLTALAEAVVFHLKELLEDQTE